MSDFFQHLPEEALSSVVSYLDPRENVRCRLISKTWRNHAVGSAGFKFVASVQLLDCDTSTCLQLKGWREERRNRNDGSEETKEEKKYRLGVGRTKGHLPEPRLLSQQKRMSTYMPTRLVTVNQTTLAFSLGTIDDSHVWETLDLAISHIRRRKCSNPSRHEWCSLTRALVMVDLSGAHYLRRLSAATMHQLEVLYLPPSLIALKANNCSKLETVRFPYGQTGHFDSINLRQCRSWKGELPFLFGRATSNVMHDLRYFDAGYANSLKPETLVDALCQVCCLESLSLRNIATSEMLLALAGSESAANTLRLVDVSFSQKVTDEACAALVKSAKHLERFNLRGCRSVSAECYNTIPILLQRRKSGGIYSDEQFSLPHPNRRKGDIIFDLDLPK